MLNLILLILNVFCVFLNIHTFTQAQGFFFIALSLFGIALNVYTANLMFRPALAYVKGKK